MNTLRKVILTVLGGSLLIGAGLVLVSVSGSLRAEPERKVIEAIPLAIDTLPITRSSFTETLNGFGLARPLRRSVVSARVSGQIIELNKDTRVGVSVDPEEVILRIDDIQNRSELSRREALLEEARADQARIAAELRENDEKLKLVLNDLEIAHRNLRRQEDLAGSGVGSEADVDRAKENLQAVKQRQSDVQRNGAILEAQTKSAEKMIVAREAEVTQAENSLSHTIVYTPFAGLLDELFVEQGDFVQPGTRLFAVVDSDALELPVEIPASRSDALRVGAPVSLTTSEQPPRQAEGVVARIAPTIDERNRTLSAFVIIEAENEKGLPFPPGTYLQASIQGRTFSDVFAVPREAIVDGAIYLAQEGKAVEFKPDFFALLDDIALTRDDLGNGSLLITSGFERLYNGAPVMVPAEVVEENAANENSTPQRSSIDF